MSCRHKIWKTFGLMEKLFSEAGSRIFLQISFGPSGEKRREGEVVYTSGAATISQASEIYVESSVSHDTKPSEARLAQGTTSSSSNGC